MITILLGVAVLALLIDSMHQRALVRHYKQKYHDALDKYLSTDNELHHLKIKYNIIPIPCWEM